MGNFIFIIVIIKPIRNWFNTQKDFPFWDNIFSKLYIIAPILFIVDISTWKKFEVLFNLCWNGILGLFIFFFWLNRKNKIAKTLFWAIIPYVAINLNLDLIEFLAPKFREKYDDYFDWSLVGVFVWMIAFGISASSQYKAQLVERKKREEEKLQLEKVEAERNSLEVLVSERTAEILKQKEDIEKTLIELKATQAQLVQSEKLASLGELTAGIAHEIQNPLNFVNNFSELSVDLAKELKEEIEKPEIDKEYIAEILGDLSQNQEKINHHGKRASSIVTGMLQHSRASTGIKELTDINQLADEYLRLSYHGLRAKDKNFNADFKTDFDENLPKINIIPQDVGRVILNLVNNAFYAVSKRVNNVGEVKPTMELLSDVKQPKVIVSTQITDKQVVIKVIDNGTGMNEATIAKIFQPFFTTKPTGQGTGLGLSLAYDIITKGHGGTIEVESEENIGTTFTITLPINN